MLAFSRHNFLVTLFLSTSGLSAASQALAGDVKWTHYGVRPLGMGNAYVAVADDYNALFYNPAGIARLKEWDGEFLNPTLEMSNKTSTFISDAQSLAGGSAGDEASVIQLLESQTGNVQHIAFGLTPHLVFPGFGFGIGAEISSTMVFHRYPTIELDVGPRVTIPFVFAKNFLEDRLSIGLGVKALLRGGIEHEFSIQDIQAFTSKKSEDGETDEEEGPKLSDYVIGGIGYGTDFGLLFTPIKPMEPTIGLSITDVGGTPFEKTDIGGEALGAPATRMPSVNVGYSMKPWQSGNWYWLTSIDAHSINQPFSFSKKLNLGTEFSLGSILKVQGGLHQGYWTGGMQFDVGILCLRFVSYAEEMGVVAGSVEDRRYALQLKLLI